MVVAKGSELVAVERHDLVLERDTCVRRRIEKSK